MKRIIFFAAVAAAAVSAQADSEIYLLIGQSNMAGRGQLSASLEVPRQGVLKMTNFGYLAPAKEPLHNDRPSAGAGLGASFANAMRGGDARKTIVLVPCAFGGSALSEWAKGSYMYQRALLRTREALRLQGKRARLAGILWHQGESDSGKEALASTYASRLVEMMTSLRADLGCGDVPVVVGELGRYLADYRAKTGKCAYFEKVNEELHRAARTLPNCECVSSEGLTPNSDVLHFNTASLRTLGERYAEAMKRLQNPTGLVAQVRAGLAVNPARYRMHSMKSHTFDRTMVAVERADRAADAAWAGLGDAQGIAAHRARLKAAMTAAVGGFPERTPLNVQSRGTVRRAGYRVERLLFESRPRHYVTALLFLPDAATAASRVPGVVVTCGHDLEGKDAASNQRAAVVLANHGLAALIFDPIDQGEREQLPGKSMRSVNGHVNAGLRAHLIGWSAAQFRIWDGIRALDVLAERPEVDASRLGVTGMSGGGTMSAYLNALDDRYTAASSMGYLTTMRELADNLGPQDMEQVVFGQLAAGVNHLSLMLMNGRSAEAPGFTYGDLFPYAGSDETYDFAKAFYAREGRADKIDKIECDGPHAWFESEKKALALWMRRHLADDRSAWPPDPLELEKTDVGFVLESVDVGLANTPKSAVLDGKGVMSIPGARSVYDLICDELAAMEKRRAAPTPDAVCRAAGISRGVRGVVLAEGSCVSNGVEMGTAVLRMPDAGRVVVHTFFPQGGAGAPVMMAVDRPAVAERVAELLSAGRPVAVVNARGFGESYYLPRPHSYWAHKGLCEELASLYVWLGRNLASARAEDYLAAGAWLRQKTVRPAELVADGDAVVPAAHAFYLDRDSFGAFAMENAPASWADIVRDPASGHPHLCNLVYGGLAAYDWTDLVKSDSRSAEVDAALGPYVDNGHIAGVVSVLSDADYNETWNCLGWADVENRVPMAPDTVFAVFSMTKTITGCAVMVAVDRGILKMDDLVADYLPEFRDLENKPTIRDCMCHMSGVNGGAVSIVHTDIPIREQARTWAQNGKCESKVGEKFKYGNMSIAAVAACLEVASGMPFEEFLKRNVLDPLGMTDTSFTPTEGMLRRLVKAYTTEGGPFRPAADMCSGQLVFPCAHKIYPMPAAGLYSTPADMLRFSQMLAHHGEWKGRRIVSRRTFDEIWAKKQTPPHISQPYTVGSWVWGDWFGHEGAMRTDQRANLKTGHSRVFFIQTENKAGQAFFDAKHDWNLACDVVQKMETPYRDSEMDDYEKKHSKTRRQYMK